jgi:hypothetical protein
MEYYTYQWKNRETILACNKGLGLFDDDDIYIKVLPVLYFFALNLFSPANDTNPFYNLKERTIECFSF